MKGPTKSQARRSLNAALLPLVLLAGGLAINCSSSDGTTQIPSAGASSAGASNAGAGTGGGTAAGAGGGSTAGASGAAACFPANYTRCTADDCADLTSDPNYCGACTTKCDASQVCNASKCSTTPTALVPAAAGCGSIRLVLSGTTLYWTDQMHGTIKSVPVAGGTPTSVVSGEMAPTFLKVNGTTLYWIASGTKQIRKATIGAAATASTVVTATEDLGGLTLTPDGNTIYYSAGKKIYKVAAAGGTATEVGAEASGTPGPLAYDDTTKKIVVPVFVNFDVDVLPTDKAGLCAGDNDGVTNKDCLRIGRSQGSLGDENVYIINGSAYWAGGSAIRSNLIATADEGNVTVASGEDNIQAFSINGTSAYFTDKTGVVYVSTTGADAESSKKKIARGQVGVTSIVGDATKAYWAASDCSILQAPLPTASVAPAN